MTNQRCFLLVDIRHAPSANDIQMFDWIDYMGYQIVVIATKLDKLKRHQVSEHLSTIRTTLGMRDDDILIPFSSKTKDGLLDIYDLMDQVVEFSDDL